MGNARIAAIIVAAIVMLIIVLIVAFMCMGMCRLTEYSARYNTVRTPRGKLSEHYLTLKTGDIILFVSSTHSPSNSILTQTFYSHVGIILREGDLVYITEAQTGAELMPRPGKSDFRMRPGADITPLLTRLKYYTGSYYILRLSRPLDPEREELVKNIAERTYQDRYPYPSTKQLVLGLFGVKTRSRHCFQHVAHILDKIGLTPLHRSAPLQDSGFLKICDEICEIHKRQLPDGYYYEPPCQLIYDIDAIPAKE